MLDASAFHLFLLILVGWLDRRERDVLAYLMEENRVLRRQLGGRRLRLTDNDRAGSRLAHTAWAEVRSGRSPRSSDRTRCCAGIASWSPESGHALQRARTWRGLVTYYTVFVIGLVSRRVQVLGSTPHPDEAFMRQVGRNLTLADEWSRRVVICDRDAKWTNRVREQLRELIDPVASQCAGRVCRRPRLGGLLNYYVRAA